LLKRGIELKIDIVWFPEGAKNAAKTGDLLIAVDTLRSSSFITTALQLGAQAIYPIASVEEAFKLAKSLKNVILAGEVNAVKVPGFDIGNSPTALLSLSVKDKIIVLRTSAGTQVIDSLRKTEAKGVKLLIGCLLNANVLAEYSYNLAKSLSKDVTIVCSGRGGTDFALEDYVAAGAIIEQYPKGVALTDSALGSLIAFKGALNDGLFKVLKETGSAKRLFEIGAGQDVEFCSQLNKQDVVPMLFDYVIKNVYGGK